MNAAVEVACWCLQTTTCTESVSRAAPWETTANWLTCSAGTVSLVDVLGLGRSNRTGGESAAALSDAPHVDGLAQGPSSRTITDPGATEVLPGLLEAAAAGLSLRQVLD
jgi:hypothetical protein